MSLGAGSDGIIGEDGPSSPSAVDVGDRAGDDCGLFPCSQFRYSACEGVEAVEGAPLVSSSRLNRSRQDLSRLHYFSVMKRRRTSWEG